MALCQMFYFSPLELEIVMGTLSMECELNRAKYINKISIPLLFNVASSNYTGQYSVNLKSYMIF